jgi:hypothetical protein
MALLIALGIWVAISAAFTPLIGYFLSEAAEREEGTTFVQHELLELQRGSRPRA